MARIRSGHCDTGVPGLPAPQLCPPFSKTWSSTGRPAARIAANMRSECSTLAIGSSVACARKTGGVSGPTCASTE